MCKPQHNYSLPSIGSMAQALLVMLCLAVLISTLHPEGLDNQKAALAVIKSGGVIKKYCVGQVVEGKVIKTINLNEVIFEDGSKLTR